MPVLLALLSSALWGTADFMGGTLSRRLSSFVVVGWSQTAGLVVAGLLVAVAPGDRPWGAVAATATAAAIFGYAGLVAFYSALARGTMGVVAPITALGGVVPVAAGLLSGEKPSSVQIVGFVIALVGVFFASGPELSGRAGAVSIALAIVAALCFGITLTFIAGGADTDALATVAFMRVVTTAVSACALVTLVLRGRGRVVKVGRGAILPLMAVGAFDVSANLTYGVAASMGLLSVVAVAGSLYPVATVILARVIHHERLVRVQQVGVAAAIVGVAAIAAG